MQLQALRKVKAHKVFRNLPFFDVSAFKFLFIIQPFAEVHVVFKAVSSTVSNGKSLLEQVSVGANRDTFLSA